jgi:hypothetical protein
MPMERGFQGTGFEGGVMLLGLLALLSRV